MSESPASKKVSVSHAPEALLEWALRPDSGIQDALRQQWHSIGTRDHFAERYVALEQDPGARNEKPGARPKPELLYLQLVVLGAGADEQRYYIGQETKTQDIYWARLS